MSPKALFVICVIFFSPINCQFEFNNVNSVADIVKAVLNLVQCSCVAILRSPTEDALQKSATERLTSLLAKNVELSEGRKISTVAAYTSESYEKFYLDPKFRQTDTCIYWITAVMVSDLTTKQIIYFSKFPAFANSFWLLFSNQTEETKLYEGLKTQLSMRLWVIRQLDDKTFLIESIFTNNPYVGGRYNWTKADGLRGNQPNHVMKLKGQTLRVGALEFPPYVNVQRNHTGHIISVSGFYGDTWNDLESRLQFKSEYIEPKDGVIGSYDENGNWTGLYGMIINGEIDVILGEMTQSATRDHVVSFLHPMERTEYQIFYKIDAEKFDWLKVFRPLNYKVWAVLIAWIVGGGVAAYLAVKVEKSLLHIQKQFSFISCIYFFLRALSNQGTEQVPRLWALRVLFLTAYLSAAVILPSYSASLISTLAVKTPVEPFKQLNDIILSDFKLALASNTTDNDFFADSEDPIHKTIYEFFTVKDTKATSSYASAIQYACNNHKAVFFGTMNEIIAGYRQMKISCTLQPLKSKISPVYKTLAVAKFSPYLTFLKMYQLQMLEFGLVKRYKRMHVRFEEEPRPIDIGISIQDVGAVFIYLGILQTLSIAIFCIEHVIWNFHYFKVLPYVD